MAGDALKVSVILAAVIVLIIIALMVEGAFVGHELDEDAQNGCCCGVATESGKYYAAPTSQKCAADYAHVAGLCSSWNCGNPGS
jgi:hypothetical protein